MSFFGMGPMELLVIVTVAFIIFGPEKMTDIMGGLGRAVREFRAMTSDLTGEFERTVNDVRETAEELLSSTREALTVEGLNPFEQPTSPGAIAAHDAIAAGNVTIGDAPTAVPAAARPTRSLGPTPSKADPLADFAVFGEPAPVQPPAAEPEPVAEPVAEAEVLAPVEASDSFEGAVAANGHHADEPVPDAAGGDMLAEQATSTPATVPEVAAASAETEAPTDDAATQAPETAPTEPESKPAQVF